MSRSCGSSEKSSKALQSFTVQHWATFALRVPDDDCSASVVERSNSNSCSGLVQGEAQVCNRAYATRALSRCFCRNAQLRTQRRSRLGQLTGRHCLHSSLNERRNVWPRLQVGPEQEGLGEEQWLHWSSENRISIQSFCLQLACLNLSFTAWPCSFIGWVYWRKYRVLLLREVFYPVAQQQQ